MTILHVKKGDIVKMLAGDDKGKTGKVLEVMPRENKVLVEGINIVKKHQRPTKQGQKGQTIEKPMPVHASNVASTEKSSKPAKKEKKAKVVKAKAKK